jgi:hypothetical protein
MKMNEDDSPEVFADYFKSAQKNVQPTSIKALSENGAFRGLYSVTFWNETLMQATEHRIRVDEEEGCLVVLEGFRTRIPEKFHEPLFAAINALHAAVNA